MPHIESSYNDVIYAVPPMSRPNGNIMTLKNQKKLLKALDKTYLVKRWKEMADECLPCCLCDREIYTVRTNKDPLNYVIFRRVGNDQEEYPVLVEHLSKEGSEVSEIYIECLSLLEPDEMLDYLAAPDDDGNVPCCDKFDGSMLEDLSQPLDYHKAKEYIEAADIRAMVAADYALGGLQLFIVQMNGEGKRPTLRIFRADEEKTRERIIDDAGRVDAPELCTAMVFPKPEFQEFSVYAKRYSLQDGGRASMYICKKTLYRGNKMIADEGYHYIIITSSPDDAENKVYTIVNPVDNPNGKKVSTFRWTLSEKDIINHFIRIADALVDCSPVMDACKKIGRGDKATFIPEDRTGLAMEEPPMEFMFSEDEDDTYYLTAHSPIMAALTFVTLRSPLTSIIDAFYVTPTQMEYGWVGAILKSDDDLLRPYRDPNNHWNRGIHIEGEELDERENDFFNPDGSRTETALEFWEHVDMETDDEKEEVDEVNGGDENNGEERKTAAVKPATNDDVPEGIDDPTRVSRRKRWERRQRKNSVPDSEKFWLIRS